MPILFQIVATKTLNATDKLIVFTNTHGGMLVACGKRTRNTSFAHWGTSESIGECFIFYEKALPAPL